MICQITDLEQFKVGIASLAELVGISHFRGGFYLRTCVYCHWWQNRDLKDIIKKIRFQVEKLEYGLCNRELLLIL